MIKHQNDPLSLAVKQHPVGYFCVMCLVGLAAGTIAFDLLELIDSSIAPVMKSPRYLAALVFALSAHVGVSWRIKKVSKRR